MHCPNCKTRFTSGNKCPSCNVDAVLYTGTLRLSDKLYNQGLERLKNADISAGIESLEKSVHVNKNNIPARNLLGLALFEVGHVGDALKHWVISTSLLTEDNPAKDYIEAAHKNARSLEKLNDAISMYNRALVYVRQKSDDLAIIQLKKTIETNPRFVDALNLLTLCYLIQSDKEKASTTVEKALALDAQNPTALNYYAILNPGATRPKPASTSRKAPPAPGSVRTYTAISTMREKKATNFHISEILSFVIGAICAAAIMYFLMMPALQREHSVEANVYRQQMEATQAAHEQHIQEITAEKAALQQQMESMAAEVSSIEAERDLQARILRVHHADVLLEGGQYQEVVDMLESIDTEGIPFDIVGRIESIREAAYPRVGVERYNEGLAAFNANPRNIDIALTHLEAAHRFLSEGATQWNELLFMLGTLHYDAGRLPQAEELLTSLRDRAPNHRPQGTRNMLNSIEGQRED